MEWKYIVASIPFLLFCTKQGTVNYKKLISILIFTFFFLKKIQFAIGFYSRISNRRILQLSCKLFAIFSLSNWCNFKAMTRSLEFRVMIFIHFLSSNKISLLKFEIEALIFNLLAISDGILSFLNLLQSSE